MTNKHLEKILSLKNKGVGWYIKFEVNTALSNNKSIIWNCMIYSKRQERDGIVDKVSLWNTPEQGIDWLYAWKMKDQEAMNQIHEEQK